MVSYQLLQVVLDGVGVNHDADSHQRVESKVKYLVAEEGDDPGGTQLKQRRVVQVFRLGMGLFSRETSAVDINQSWNWVAGRLLRV